MRVLYQEILPLDSAGHRQDFDIADGDTAYVQVRMVNGSWSGAVLKFLAGTGQKGGVFSEIDPLVRLSDEGMTKRLNVAGVEKLRVQVHAASISSQSRAEITVCIHNPNYP